MLCFLCCTYYNPSVCSPLGRGREKKREKEKGKKREGEEKENEERNKDKENVKEKEMRKKDIASILCNAPCYWALTSITYFKSQFDISQLSRRIGT